MLIDPVNFTAQPPQLALRHGQVDRASGNLFTRPVDVLQFRVESLAFADEVR